MDDLLRREEVLIYVFERMRVLMEQVEDKKTLDELKLLTSYILATVLSIPEEGAGDDKAHPHIGLAWG